jgi:hypothetical protein
MKYRWIYKREMIYKGNIYTNYAVIIRNKYLFSSMTLDNCIDFVIRYAQKHKINPLRTGKNAKYKKEI